MLGSLAGLFVVAAIVLALITGYLLVRAVNLVLNVLVRYPQARKPLWFALGAFLVTASAAAVSQGVPLIVLAFACFLIVVLVARSIELAHSDRFEEPGSFGLLAHNVLHEWWQDAA